MKADQYGVLLHLFYGKKLNDADDLSSLIFMTDMGFCGNPACVGKNRIYSLDNLPQEVSGLTATKFSTALIRLTACPHFMTQASQKEKHSSSRCARLRQKFG